MCHYLIKLGFNFIQEKVILFHILFKKTLNKKIRKLC